MSCCNARHLAWFVMGLGGWALAAGPLPDATLRDQAVELQNAALTAPRPAWLEAQQARQAHWQRALQVAPLRPQTPAPAIQPSDVGGPDGLRVPPPPDPSPAPSPTDATVPTPTIVVTLLVSRALGEAALRDVFALAAGRPNVRLVFRGVAENESLTDFLRGIHRLLPRDAGGRPTRRCRTWNSIRAPS